MAINEDNYNYMDESGLNITGGVKNLYLTFLQEFFAQQNDWQWCRDPEESEILIVDKNPNNLEVKEKRPKIILNRGAMQPSNVSIDKVSKRKLKSGNVKYSDLWQGSMRFQCIADNHAEAERLATKVGLALITFEPILRERGLHEHKDVTIAEEASLEQDSDIVAAVCPVRLRYSAQFTWELVRSSESMTGACIELCVDQGELEQQIQVDEDN